MGKKRFRGMDLLVENIRYYTTRRVKPEGYDSEVFAIDHLLARSQRVLRVAFDQSAQRDGYPSSTPGNGSPGAGKGGGQVMEVGRRDEHGVKVVEHLPTSSTEMAALAGPQPDPVARLGGHVRRQLRELDDLLADLERNLDRFDVLRSTAKVEDPPMCWVAQVKYQLPWDILWEPFRTTDFAGQLDQPFDEPRRISKFVYWFVRNNGRLPSKAEMQQHLARSTVKLRGA